MSWQTFIQARDSTIRNGERARDEQNAMRLQGVQQQAGSLIAGGDMTGGANALLSAGDITGGMSVYTGQRQQQTADRERQRAAILGAASGLRRIPMAERGAVFQTSIVPVFQAEGLGDIIGQISPEMMDDATLESLIVSLGGEVEDRQTFNTRQGVVERDPYSGTYNLGYELPADPNAALEQDLLQARIDATRAQVGQREAAAEKSRRAPAGRGGGGGSRSSAPARASAPAGRPWQRSW